MEMNPLSVFWLMLASAGVGGLLMILSAFVTGYLVFRAKREQHETLFAPAMPKGGKPIVVDDLAIQDDDGLPDVIRQMNQRMAESVARAGLKGDE